MTSPELGRIMLISVHPRHVERILDGTKTVELRRTKPAIDPGQPAVIYATMPSGALVATCRIAAVEVSAPSRLWRTVGSAAQVSRAEFDRYYCNSTIAVALHLNDVRPLSDPVTLGQLRARSRFHPPQTWHFVNERDLRFMLGGHPSAHVMAELITC
ncbi:ASCH domain-containing protein [Nakamurella multipartita]|uniref:ASCH domain-containing protein n=1 Tax=Nakamurella multipartita (strain ATCC 700099 / DSM 44233 / CIP 104796 / JCM 9543 / NBRC 105858 / Y-104) TaxID=479431 RepID=C8X8J7_NAKMY|nr:ASCH domain-containing protein [Nakamurella multipartita]ACV79052.1 protein of unknown function DUF437 [Nakamurella multipartita DSM 44233]